MSFAQRVRRQPGTVHHGGCGDNVRLKEAPSKGCMASCGVWEGWGGSLRWHLLFGFYHIHLISAVRSMTFMLPSALFPALSLQLLHLALFQAFLERITKKSTLVK